MQYGTKMQLTNIQAKSIFEATYGKEISTRSWFRVKSLMTKYSLKLTEDDIKSVAVLKLRINFSKLSLENILLFSSLIKSQQPHLLNGSNAYKEIQKITNFEANKSTILRWFKLCDRRDGKYFDRNRSYTIDELLPCFVSAYLYIEHKKKQTT